MFYPHNIISKLLSNHQPGSKSNLQRRIFFQNGLEAVGDIWIGCIFDVYRFPEITFGNGKSLVIFFMNLCFRPLITKRSIYAFLSEKIKTPGISCIDINQCLGAVSFLLQICREIQKRNNMNNTRNYNGMDKLVNTV